MVKCNQLTPLLFKGLMSVRRTFTVSVTLGVSHSCFWLIFCLFIVCQSLMTTC